jgi:hypothetical protein
MRSAASASEWFDRGRPTARLLRAGAVGLLAATGIGLLHDVQEGGRCAARLGRASRLVNAVQQASEHLVRLDAYARIYSRGAGLVATQEALAKVRGRVEDDLARVLAAASGSAAAEALAALNDDWTAVRNSTLRLEGFPAPVPAADGEALSRAISRRAGSLQERLTALAATARAGIDADAAALELWSRRAAWSAGVWMLFAAAAAGGWAALGGAGAGSSARRTGRHPLGEPLEHADEQMHEQV